MNITYCDICKKEQDWADAGDEQWEMPVTIISYKEENRTVFSMHYETDGDLCKACRKEATRCALVMMLNEIKREAK